MLLSEAEAEVPADELSHACEGKQTVKHVVESKTQVMTEAGKYFLFDLSSHRAPFSPVTNLLHTHTNTPRAKICILLCPRF